MIGLTHFFFFFEEIIVNLVCHCKGLHVPGLKNEIGEVSEFMHTYTLMLKGATVRRLPEDNHTLQARRKTEVNCVDKRVKLKYMKQQNMLWKKWCLLADINEYCYFSKDLHLLVMCEHLHMISISDDVSIIIV